eukprot:TRINITY_DN27682_c0_g2_i1.p1 TRINITY_DN27682_c0_g2~~TRINITY_DN27682_c0_g2_i1.p1  ORF type:complete len:1370 (-),score=205.40 TRINITY_DN27682_c0_g2_i1:43-4152(-)
MVTIHASIIRSMSGVATLLCFFAVCSAAVVPSRQGHKALLQSEDNRRANLVKEDITVESSTSGDGDVDCEFESWTEWSECQFSCGGGESIRTRTVKTEARGRGAACDSNLRNTRLCNENPCPVDCVWDDWQPWGVCSVTCGRGEKEKMRAKKEKQQFGGRACEGSSTISEACQDSVCPVDCKWNDWGQWEGCSVSCGMGDRSRYRSVAQAKNDVGQECPGQNTESQSCGMNTCPVDCAMEDWQAWDPCDVSCGVGQTSRVREITTTPVFGGRKCDAHWESKSCDAGLCPVDCILSDWSDWAACSISCSNGDGSTPGVSERFRTVAQSKNELGDECPGETTQKNACNLARCPVDCKLSDWSVWSDCSSTCGPGVSERTRKIVTKPIYGGKVCFSDTYANETYEKKYCSKDTCPVDCMWADWQNWRSCSTTCSTGNSARIRLVKTPMQHGGKMCEGGSTQDRECNEGFCPVHCEWNDWSDWEECSVSCASGVQSKKRTVKVQADFGGIQCTGQATKSQECKVVECPIHCKWGDWSAWGSCSSSCGNSTQSRTRSKDIEATFAGRECEGPPKEIRDCDGVPVCPVDCEWEVWTEWTLCSTTCDAGVARRSRKRKVYEASGGHACYGTEDDEKACDLQECPIHCVLADWGQWSACSVTCGIDGTQRRSRGTQVQAQFGGVECNQTDFNDTKICDYVPCPVHCEWGNWTDWSECTVTCAGGQTMRKRLELVAAQHGGNLCQGSDEEENVCNAEGCPVDCSYEDWTDWTDCTRSCAGGSRMATRSLITAAEWGGKECDKLGPSKVETCNDQPCPVNCEWLDWSHWSICSKTCSGGEKNRSRTRSPERFGGRPCQGDEAEKLACNTEGCPVDCMLSTWSEWTACSKRCGGGSIMRFREITLQAKNGGDACLGKLEQDSPCNEDPCPVDCEWDDWSEWSVCPVSCGGGLLTSKRNKIQTEMHGGRPCSENATKVKSCAEETCPVDCTFTEWEEWGLCSVSCNNGTRFRTRQKNAAVAGGAPCEGRMFEAGVCENMFNSLCTTTTTTMSSAVTSTSTTATPKHEPDPKNVIDPKSEKGKNNLLHAWSGEQRFPPGYVKDPRDLTTITTTRAKPCAEDKLDATLEAYDAAKFHKVEPADPKTAKSVEAIDRVINNLTGEAVKVNYTYNELVLGRTTTITPTVPQSVSLLPVADIISDVKDMLLSGGDREKAIELLSTVPRPDEETRQLKEDIASGKYPKVSSLSTTPVETERLPGSLSQAVVREVKAANTFAPTLVQADEATEHYLTMKSDRQASVDATGSVKVSKHLFAPANAVSLAEMDSKTVQKQVTEVDDSGEASAEPGPGSGAAASYLSAVAWATDMISHIWLGSSGERLAPSD